jgi:putative alpha-1,2-mannosidase
MSAWYVMASLGLYQVEPCGGRYQLCTPAVKKAVLNVGDGKTFVIKTRGTGIYAKRWILNGRPLKGTVLNHRDIVNGGALEVELCN